MTMQRVLGAAMTNPFWQIIEEFTAMRHQVEHTEWPVEMVLGDDITNPLGFFFDSRAHMLTQLDQAIAQVRAAEELYLNILAALP